MGINHFLKMLRDRINRTTLYSTADYWDSKAKAYVGDAVSMWPNNNLNTLYHLEQLEYFDNHFNIKPGETMLDMGCGTGRLSRFLVKQGANVTGRDFSEKSVAIARSLSTGDNPVYSVQSIFDLDDQEAFETILLWGVLTVACKNKEELVDALQRLWRATKPQGKLILLEPIHRGPLHRVLDMSLPLFLTCLKEVGFHVDDVQQLHFWPARICLAYVPLPNLITIPVYKIGRICMSLPFLNRLGDYKAIRCIKM